MFRNDIRSSFKSENLVIMRVLTASIVCSETYNLSVHCTLYRDSRHHILCHKTQNTFSFLICFCVFARIYEHFFNGSKISLNKSFKTSYTFLRGSKYQTSSDVVHPQFKSPNTHSSTLRLKDSSPWVVFNGKTQNLPYDS